MKSILTQITEIKKCFMPTPIRLIGKIRIEDKKAKFQFGGGKREIIFSLADEKEKIWGLNLRTWELGLIDEQFFKQEYKELEVEGMEVLDIGSSIGDTAIYFVTKGAKKVYCYEVIPRLREIAVENVSLNSLNRLIIQKSGNLNLGKMINSCNLNDAVMKCDCEGGEYELFGNAIKEEIRTFSQIILEYHKKPDSLIIKFKKAGFKIRILRKTGKETGIILATRIVI